MFRGASCKRSTWHRAMVQINTERLLHCHSGFFALLFFSLLCFDRLISKVHWSTCAPRTVFLSEGEAQIIEWCESRKKELNPLFCEMFSISCRAVQVRSVSIDKPSATWKHKTLIKIFKCRVFSSSSSPPFHSVLSTSFGLTVSLERKQ